MGIIAIVISLLAACAAWYAVWVQRKQVQMSGFLMLEQIMQAHRKERDLLLSEWDEAHSSDEALGREFVRAGDSCRQWAMRVVACDFNEFGVLFHHEAVAKKPCLDLFADMVLRHWDTWLRLYIEERERSRPKYLRFVKPLADQASRYQDSLNG